MKSSFARELVCPISRDPLRLDAATGVGDVVDGELVCDGCGRRWPVENGVPRLVRPDLGELQRETAAAFGWQWRHFPELHPEFEAQFLDWLHPLTPESFRGKRVLDAGCGTGRHAYLAAEYGAAEVVALDLSEAVDTARRNLGRFEHVHVVQGDLLDAPLRPPSEGGGFDLVYSIGVLHHLPDPHAGFAALLRHVRPGGTIAIWVYGYENNGFVRNVVEPLRRVSTTVPTPLVRALAWPLAVAFHGVARFVYRPLSDTRVGRRLPLDEYMTDVAGFSFRQNYGIVFDQLAAPKAEYLKRKDVESWLRDSKLEDVHLSHRHGNSWRAQGRLPLT